MIYGYCGEFGSGKTAGMTFHLIKKMYLGIRVITNYPIKVIYKPFGQKAKLCQSEEYINGYEFRKKIETESNCIIGCDETSIYLPQEWWKTISEEVRFKLHLVEHFRTDLWYTVQDFAESVIAIRRLTNGVYLADKFNFGLFKIFRYKKYRKKYFEGMPTEKKEAMYYRGTSWMFPSEARMVYKAYEREFKFDKFQFGEFNKNFSKQEEL
jgi:hypothetical protein